MVVLDDMGTGLCVCCGDWLILRMFACMYVHGSIRMRGVEVNLFSGANCTHHVIQARLSLSPAACSLPLCCCF